MIEKKVAIIGYGAIGKAFYKYLKETPSIAPLVFFIYDPSKGFDHIPHPDVDMYFICVNVSNDGKNRQDLSNLERALKLCNPLKPIFIRSTILPGTCDRLNNDHGFNCIAMPEFMTEAKADTDMRYIPWIVGKTDCSSAIEAVKPIGKEVVYLSNAQCEFLKYWHNTFLAMKNNITNLMFDIWTKFATGKVPNTIDQYNIHDLQKIAEFDQIADQLPISGIINQSHLKVLHRGKRGFDGKCLPKDLSCFVQWLQDIGFEKVGPFMLCDTLNKELLNNGKFAYSKRENVA